MDIVLTGSVAFDYLMTFPGYFREHILPDHLDKISLSFLVDSMVRRRGGIAPNIAYTLSLFGEKPVLWATVGEDFDEYNDWLESRGIDTRGIQVIPNEYTASFFVNTDLSQAQIASFYPGAMAFAAQNSLLKLRGKKPDLVVISPNAPEAMIQHAEECQELGVPYIYDPSQQIVRLSGDDLCSGISAAHALFVNEYEYELIRKMTKLEKEAILECDPVSFIVVTRGKMGSTVYSRTGEISIPVVQPERISDPTGVGDAFRGGFLAGYSRGLGLEICAQMGALAASYCLENHGTQGHFYNPEDFVKRFRQHFNDNGQLDILIEKGQ
ncbi:MAG: carbohydrate kinase family protein [Anaerolineales bacterium]